VENDYENDEGVKLLIEIIIEEEAKKADYADFSPEQEDMMDTKIENILVIAEGLTYESIVYMTDVEAEFEKPDEERQKIVFDTTSKNEASKIQLMKDYFATKDIKPLQDYWDGLFGG